MCKFNVYGLYTFEYTILNIYSDCCTDYYAENNSKKIKIIIKKSHRQCNLFHRDLGTSLLPVPTLLSTLFHSSCVTPFHSTNHLNEAHLWFANHMLGLRYYVKPCISYQAYRTFCLHVF